MRVYFYILTDLIFFFMRIVDTNILYYKFANNRYPTELNDAYITSINALKFLRNIEKRHPNRANYYLPLLSKSDQYGRGLIPLLNQHPQKGISRRCQMPFNLILATVTKVIYYIITFQSLDLSIPATQWFSMPAHRY